jgi:hypothetical protein
LGNVQLRQGETKAALDSFKQSLGVRRKLAEADPRSAQAQRDMLFSYYKLGDLAQQSSDFSTAVGWFSKAREVPTVFPGSEVFKQDVAILDSRLSFCRAAEQGIMDLASIDKQPPDQRFPLLAAVQRALVERKEPGKAVQAAEKLAGMAKEVGEAYNAACAFALCVPLADKEKAGDELAARAMDLLRQAVAKGF